MSSADADTIVMVTAMALTLCMNTTQIVRREVNKARRK